MLRTALLRTLAAAAIAAAALPSHARTWEYYFGTWLGSGPGYEPAGTFAFMSVTTLDNYSFDFVLRAYDPAGGGDLTSAFGQGAYISKAVFNSVSGSGPISLTNVQTNGYVSSVSMGVGDLSIGGIEFDFFDGLSGSGNLQGGEWISWTLNFATVQDPLLATPPVALRVQGFGADGAGNGWYTPTSPIPEPQTMAMLLAGLGLMAFVARRRQVSLASP